MRFLRQATASQEILLGPFVAAADGTAQTGLTIANTDIKLLLGGATAEQNKNSGGGTHIAGGRYSAVLDATDTATVGVLEVSVNPASGIPWNKSYYVLEEAIYDALFAASATGLLPANVTQFGGSNGTFASGRPEVNTTHAAGTAWNSGAIGANTLAGDTITAAKVAADVTTEIQSGLATAAELAKVPKSDSNVTWNATALASINAQADTALADYDGPTNAELATALAGADDAVLAAIATVDGNVDTILATTAKLDDTLEDSGGGAYIFTEASLANAPAGGGGGGDATEAKQDTIIALIGTPAGASVSADILAVKTETASILADTDDIGVAGAGLTAIPWNAAWDAEVQSEATDALNAYDPPTRAELTTDTNSVLTAVGDVPTNAELATALGTADDAVLAQIALVKAKTDSLTFTVANVLDANVQRINDVTITGDGQPGTEFGVS
jgi:hypothetical protein